MCAYIYICVCVTTHLGVFGDTGQGDARKGSVCGGAARSESPGRVDQGSVSRIEGARARGLHKQARQLACRLRRCRPRGCLHRAARLLALVRGRRGPPQQKRRLAPRPIPLDARDQ
jgi:hypothetical protein